MVLALYYQVPRCMSCWAHRVTGGWLGVWGTIPVYQYSLLPSTQCHFLDFSDREVDTPIAAFRIRWRTPTDSFRKERSRRTRLPDHDGALQCAGAGAGTGERLRGSAALGEGAGRSRGRAGLGAQGNPRRHRPRRLRGLRLGRPRARAGRQAGRDNALAAQDAGTGGGGGGIARPPRRAEPGAGGGGASRHGPLAAGRTTRYRSSATRRRPRAARRKRTLPAPEAAAARPAWPREELDRIRTLRDHAGAAPLPPRARRC